ncbi:unnamed protein product [Cuscuta campestris]|uniref:RNase H type-1 domain-containing protein n=1 Tax=Cuscuta campestris TaxID=132261 RepID=A0A484MLV3_9ASTE|nr:unnamed protein product [Cuscuta campestris]
MFSATSDDWPLPYALLVMAIRDEYNIKTDVGPKQKGTKHWEIDESSFHSGTDETPFRQPRPRRQPRDASSNTPSLAEQMAALTTTLSWIDTNFSQTAQNVNILSQEIKCQSFLATLEGQACEWFHKLPKGSIDKWSDLAHKFLEHFASSRRQKLLFSHLLNVKIWKGEQLWEFINRWEKEGRDVPGADDQALIAILQAALPQGDVRKELHRNPLSTYQEMLARAKYLALEEEDDEPPIQKEKKNGQSTGEKEKERFCIQDAPKLSEYHCISTHNTSECVTLKKEMDQLIARGLPPRPERQTAGNRTLRRPAAAAAAITTGEGQEDGRRHMGRDCEDLDEEERHNCQHLGCRFIMGGNTRGDSASSRRKWKNMVHLAEEQRPPLPKRKKKEPLIFTDEDYPPVLIPHRDALVVNIEINNVVVHHMLVDTGSSINIMYSNTFKELGLSRGDLKPIRTPLSGFTRDTIEAERTIIVKAGAHPIHVLSQNPIGTLIRSPNAPSRVSKWGVFLGPFQIEFKSRPAIKGQALEDFVVECTTREVETTREEQVENLWTIYTDGSSATDASWGGVVAISPEGFKAYYCIRFRFKVSNNEAKYEALLCGLRLAASLKGERIQVRCDSKLIVGHVTGESEAKDERIKKYRDTALELLKVFGVYRIEQVPQEENAKADILSKLGPDSPDHIKAMTQEEELLEPSISPGQVLVITLNEPDWIDELTMYCNTPTRVTRIQGPADRVVTKFAF